MPTTDSVGSLLTPFARIFRLSFYAARKQFPEIRIVLAGMQMPPSLGRDYTAAFRNIYPELASANNIYLIPFLLEGVGDVPQMNLPDGIHPDSDGHKRVAVNVWQILEPLLRNDAGPAGAE